MCVCVCVCVCVYARTYVRTCVCYYVCCINLSLCVHFRVDEFSRGNAPSNELQIYTWSVGRDVQRVGTHTETLLSIINDQFGCT